VTPQRQKILALIAHGETTKTIAVELGISEQAVKWHVGRLLKEFGAPNRSALVFRAIGAHALSVPRV